mgnify:CR=1 FL=1
MSEPNNQSNELSLDQLDGINGGTVYDKINFSQPRRSREPRGKAQAEGGMTTKSRKSMKKIR